MTRNRDGSLRIGVISGYYPGRRFNSLVNHGAYCDRHGYYYIEAGGPGRHQRPHFRKLEVIRRYLALFDWVFWIDDDAYFTDLATPLESFLDVDPAVQLVICRSPSHKRAFTKFSSGSFFLRNSPTGRLLLDAAYAVDLERVRTEFWRDDLGQFTEGDQTALVYVTETLPPFNVDAVRILPHEAFNCRAEEYRERLEEHFLVHFLNDKAREKRDFCRRLGVNEYLLPPEVLGAYRVRPEPTTWQRGLGRLRRLVRRLARRGR